MQAPVSLLIPYPSIPPTWSPQTAGRSLPRGGSLPACPPPLRRLRRQRAHPGLCGRLGDAGGINCPRRPLPPRASPPGWHQHPGPPGRHPHRSLCSGGELNVCTSLLILAFLAAGGAGHLESGSPTFCRSQNCNSVSVSCVCPLPWHPLVSAKLSFPALAPLLHCSLLLAQTSHSVSPWHSWGRAGLGQEL